MSLQDRIGGDLKDAMRAGDVLRRETLRMALAALKNKRIEIGEDLSDEDQLAVLQKAVKSRQDSVTQYRDAGRDDLADKEQAEIDVLAGYLPQQFSEDETAAAVKAIVEELGLTEKKDLGRLMKELMARHRGTVDGKLAQQAASALLG